MKKIGLVLFAIVLALAVPTAAFSWGSYYAPGNVAVGVDVGAGFGFASLYVAAYPYAEFMLAKYHVADSVPLDFGIEVRGHAATELGAFGSGLSLGAGALGMVHLGFRGLDVGPFSDYLSRFDVFWGLGLAWDLIDSLFVYPGFGFTSVGGFNYFLNDNTAVTLSETYWRGYADTTIGIRLKLGPGETIGQALKK